MFLLPDFQSQTRRLLPRNVGQCTFNQFFGDFSIADATLASPQRGPKICPPNHALFSIADATLASPQRKLVVLERDEQGRFQSQTRRLLPRNDEQDERHDYHFFFNRRRDACFPATSDGPRHRLSPEDFQSQTRRLLPRNRVASGTVARTSTVFNRRRDACFPATALVSRNPLIVVACFQSQTRRLLPRNCGGCWSPCGTKDEFSIADATLASPQHYSSGPHTHVGFFFSIADATLASPQRGGWWIAPFEHDIFNRRRDACFPAT